MSHRKIAFPKTPNVNLLASVRRHPLYILFTSSQGAVFLVNSRQRDFSCGPHCCGQALSRSYGRFFAEFLNEDSLVPLGLLALSTCGGFRYGATCMHLRDISWKALHPNRHGKNRTFLQRTDFADLTAVFRICLEHNLQRQKHQTIKMLGPVSFVFPSVSHMWRAGILTSCPSTTAFAIALGPPNPPSISVAEETLDFRGARFSPAL